MTVYASSGPLCVLIFAYLVGDIKRVNLFKFVLYSTGVLSNGCG